MTLRLWAEPDPRSTKDYGSGMRVQSPVSEHGPRHGRVYLHVLFCDLFLFIGISFDISLVSQKQTLTAVCVRTKKHDWPLLY